MCMSCTSVELVKGVVEGSSRPHEGTWMQSWWAALGLYLKQHLSVMLAHACCGIFAATLCSADRSAVLLTIDIF